MDLQELYEWEEYYRLEPFGSPTEDERWRLFLSLYYSVNTKAGTEQPDWFDRDPEETARKRALITLEDKLENFFNSIAVEKEPVLQIEQQTVEPTSGDEVPAPYDQTMTTKV